MIRVIDSYPVQDGIRFFEYAGTSGDSKPTENVSTGSVFIEVDTSDLFFFDEESGTWNKFVSDSGGET